MMTITFVITIVSAFFCPSLYKEVIDKSKISEKVSGIIISEPCPIWFSYSDDTIYTSRALDNTDVNELRSLVKDTCAIYNDYILGIGKLAFASNTNTENIIALVLLTVCFVVLGCCARTLFDFIGRRCYIGNQDMNVWWPWYVFRPLICAPVAALLIVAVRTSFFSNLFISKDLNTYLVISFIAGFAMIEFLSMLRRLSKSLFDGDSQKK